MKKVYECWEESKGTEMTEISFFPSDNDVARSLLKAGARLIYRIEARSWEEAMAEHHKRQGWEPYRP
jgi:hypothetical protein